MPLSQRRRAETHAYTTKIYSRIGDCVRVDAHMAIALTYTRTNLSTDRLKTLLRCLKLCACRTPATCIFLREQKGDDCLVPFEWHIDSSLSRWMLFFLLTWQAMSFFFAHTEQMPCDFFLASRSALMTCAKTKREKRRTIISNDYITLCCSDITIQLQFIHVSRIVFFSSFDCSNGKFGLLLDRISDSQPMQGNNLTHKCRLTREIERNYES